MKYRRYKRKRRSYKKKRFFKKKRFGSKSNADRYNGSIGVKIEVEGEVIIDGSGDAQIGVNWTSSNTPATTPTMCFSDSAEWTTYSGIYSEYQIAGVKMVLTPVSSFNVLNASLGNVHCGSKTIPSLMDNPQVSNLMKCCDYRTQMMNRPMKKYVGVRKFLKKRNTYVWGPTGTTTVFGDLSTIFRVEGVSVPITTVIATCVATWYIRFRNPISGA